MINITKEELENKLQILSPDFRDRLLMLDYEDSFKKIVNFKSIKNEDIIGDVSYATQVAALGFASKQEMFELILETIGDVEETKHIFEEIDRTILVPNNLQGAPETTSTSETKQTAEEVKVTSNEQLNNQTTETAEDILKEIENPTPAPSTIPTFTPAVVTPTQTPPPVITTPPTPEIVPTQTPVLTQTSPTPSSNPASMVMPTKEDVLNSKLAEPSAQPLKSTYYKIDPYREQTK